MKAFKQLAVRLLLGRQKRYCDVLMLRGNPYIVTAEPYISLEDIVNRAVKSGVLTAQGEIVKEEDS